MLTNCIPNSLKRYPLSFLLLVAITLLSLMPIGHIKLVEDVPLADKWTHMVMYGGLTFTIWMEYWRNHQQVNWIRLLIGGFAAPVVMGGIMELLQTYATTYRSGEWLDLLADTVGVCIGAGLGFLVLQVGKKHYG